MKEKILSLLNIKASESGVVFDLMFVQLFLGIATAFLTIASYTLFLHTYSISYLPHAYLCIAVTLVIINIFYEKLEHTLSPVIMLKIIAVAAIITLLIFWSGLFFNHSKWIIFVLIVWGSILYMLAGYAFWGLVSLLFNIRESKRVFSIVGSGDAPAKLLGYLSVTILVKIIDTENLLWFSIVAFAVSIFLVSKFVKKYQSKIAGLSVVHHHHEQPHSQEKQSGVIGFIFKNNLIFSISLFSLISYIVFTLVDFTFLSEVKAKFSNITELATFIATFFGIGRFLSLLLKISITSRVIARLGVITSMIITPIVLLVYCFFFFSSQVNASNSLYMFGMMALLTEVLRSTIQEPVFFILFQPLKEHLRLKGHMIAKGYMLPPALIIVGTSLLLLFNAGITVTIMLTIKILFVVIIVWAAIILYVRKSYITTLHTSIKKGIFNSDEVFIPDSATNDILLRKTEDGDGMEVIYALHILEKSGFEKIQQLLEAKLSSQNDEVKKYAIGRIEQLGITSAIDKITLLLHNDADTEVKNSAFNALSKLDDHFISGYVNDLSKLNPFLKKVTITQIITRRHFNELIKAGNELNNLIYSQQKDERLLALAIITDLNSIKFDNIIELLLKDIDHEVRKKAMITVAKLKIDKLLPTLIESLYNTTDKYLARKALIDYGDQLFVPEMHPEITDPLHVLQFIKIAGKVKGQLSTTFLLKHVNDETLTRDKAINALWEKKFEATPTEESKLSQVLEALLQQTHTKIKYHDRIPEFEDIQLLKNAIFREVKNNVLLTLKICSMIYDRKKVNRVLELIELKQGSKLFNGIEMLEILLPKNIFSEINIQLEFI